MAFLSAMDYQQDCHTLGENGAPELTAKGVGAPLVALFFKLVRGLPERIYICSVCGYHCYHEICTAAVACAAACKHPQLLSYLLLHALHEVG